MFLHIAASSCDVEAPRTEINIAATTSKSKSMESVLPVSMRREHWQVQQQ